MSFLVRLLKRHVYSKVNDKQILHNFRNVISLGSFISLKREDVYNRHEMSVFSKKNVQFQYRGCMCICLYFFL